MQPNTHTHKIKINNFMDGIYKVSNTTVFKKFLCTALVHLFSDKQNSLYKHNLFTHSLVLLGFGDEKSPTIPLLDNKG